MARKLRIQEKGMIHHVMARGNSKNKIFSIHEDRRKYLQLIMEYKRRYQFKVYAYCLMDNHIHLLVEEDEMPLSKFMQGIQQSYTQYFNKKYNRTGHVFEQRYKSIPCAKEVYLERLIAYIHYNPVEAGLVKMCDQYIWSGHREIMKEKKDSIIDREDLSLILDGQNGIESYIKILHNFSNVSEEWIDEAYLAADIIEDKLDKLLFEKLKIEKRQTLTFEELAVKIQDVYLSSNEKIDRITYRKVFVPLAYKYGEGNREEMANLLEISPSRVSNINREYEENKIAKDIRVWIDRIERHIKDL